MSQPTIAVKDANNVTQIINSTNNNGATIAANSQPVVIASDQTPIPVVMPDGGIVAIGSTTDPAATSDTGPNTIVAMFKRALQGLTSILSIFAPSVNNTTTAYVSNIIAKNTPGKLRGFVGYSSSANTQYIQVFDSSTLPADGAIPLFSLAVPSASNFSYDAGFIGRVFVNGITICNSSTINVKTIGAPDTMFDVQFV